MCFLSEIGVGGGDFGVSKKKWGLVEKLRVRQQTGWLKKLCGSCALLDGL